MSYLFWSLRCFFASLLSGHQYCMIFRSKCQAGFLSCCQPRFFSTWVMALLFLTVGFPAFSQEVQDVEKLDKKVNTEEYDEASPVISLDGRSLYFTRTGSPDFTRNLIFNGEYISSTLCEIEYLLLGD